MFELLESVGMSFCIKMGAVLEDTHFCAFLSLRIMALTLQLKERYSFLLIPQFFTDSDLVLLPILIKFLICANWVFISFLFLMIRKYD